MRAVGRASAGGSLLGSKRLLSGKVKVLAKVGRSTIDY